MPKIDWSKPVFVAGPHWALLDTRDYFTMRTGSDREQLERVADGKHKRGVGCAIGETPYEVVPIKVTNNVGGALPPDKVAERYLAWKEDMAALDAMVEEMYRDDR